LFHKFAVLQPQLFDLLARFFVRFVLNLAHFKFVFIDRLSIGFALWNLSCCDEMEKPDRCTL
jgi:hypothetical protein